MKYNTSRSERPWLNVVVAVVLFLNIIVLGRVQGLYRLPGEQSELSQARNGAELVAGHITRLAEGQGFSSNAAVQESIARLHYDVKRARTVDEVSQALQKGLFETQAVMAREEETMRREAIVSVFSRSSVILARTGKASVTLSRDEAKDIKIIDPLNLVDAATVAELSRNSALQHAFPYVVVEIDNGQIRVPTQRTLTDRVSAQEQELTALRVEMQSIRSSAGFLSLTGPGVRIKLWDAFGGFTEDEIVHDSDVRDIINELNAAGALGVAVGGERITAQTAVRCAGPIILVNQRPVAVNPVVLEAVGDANILASSLSLVRTTLLATKGIKLEVEKLAYLTLPAYAPLR
ncbi:MAG: hypothetical protein FD169_190 [Bacillota bacterium]|nr:MAG: hypothetical protein FD169_190 [Bacillota bacterium]MBS3951201.1 DUF881 domain-containing protein [Peptococcaceae bacterium]